MTRNNISGADHQRNQEYVRRVNTKNGWFDKPVSFLEAMALLMTEVVEVNDAYYDEGLLGGWQARSHMASEFADCYIRLLDDCERVMSDLSVTADLYQFGYEYRKGDSFDGVCMQLVRRIRDAIESYRKHGLTDEGAALPDTAKHLAWFYLQFRDTCDAHGVDLMKAFDAKMAVNELREYRHGNKYA